MVSTSFGFEVARSASPLVEHVGPILLKENTSHDQPSILSVWFTGKSEWSVVYINMGHSVEPTIALTQAIVEGLQSTRYSVVYICNLWNIKDSKVGGLE